MARRPWGSGTIKPIVSHGKTIGYQVRWSLGVDPFTGRQVRKAESHHGITKAQARRILEQRIEARGTVTCPECGAEFRPD